MRLRSLPQLVAVLVLVALMVVSAATAGDASLRIFWRYAVLSYDNPLSQHADELISESSPISQAGAEARQFTRLVSRPTGRLVAPAVQPYDAAPDLGAGITRAPPAA